MALLQRAPLTSLSGALRLHGAPAGQLHRCEPRPCLVICRVQVDRLIAVSERMLQQANVPESGGAIGVQDSGEAAVGAGEVQGEGVERDGAREQTSDEARVARTL